MIQAGNLSVGGLAGVSGNSVRFGGVGMSARFNLGTNTTSGTWYYSMIVRLADITGLSSSGVFWAGFNNSSGTQSTTPTSVGTRLIAKSVSGGFQLGLDKSSGSPANFTFYPTVFTPNDTIFVVGSYTFNTGTTSDDLSQTWINPPASSFGQASVPPPDLTSTNGGDLSQLASFVLFNRISTEPPLIYADELRVGASWASVTPPAESAVLPILSIAQSASNSVLSWTTNAPGFILETSPAVTDPNSWTNVASFVFVNGSNYVVTNSTGIGPAYYRLRLPQ